jgi:hypothetical protein
LHNIHRFAVVLLFKREEAPTEAGANPGKKQPKKLREKGREWG